MPLLMQSEMFAQKHRTRQHILSPLMHIFNGFKKFQYLC